jgi:hypothetical protein
LWRCTTSRWISKVQLLIIKNLFSQTLRIKQWRESIVARWFACSNVRFTSHSVNKNRLWRCTTSRRISKV